jgi:hypothetical protein
VRLSILDSIPNIHTASTFAVCHLVKRTLTATHLTFSLSLSLSLPLKSIFLLPPHTPTVNACPCGCSSQVTSVHTCRLVVILLTTLVGDSFKPACERLVKHTNFLHPFSWSILYMPLALLLLTYLLCSFNKFSPLLTQRPLSHAHTHSLPLSCNKPSSSA